MNGEKVQNLTNGVSFYHVYNRMTSENVAEKFGITREEQDKFALLSQQRLVPGVKGQCQPYYINCHGRLNLALLLIFISK